MEYTTKSIPIKDFTGELTKWGEDRKKQYQELEKEFSKLGYTTELTAVVSIDEDNKQYFERVELTIDGDIEVMQYDSGQEVRFYHNKIHELPFINESEDTDDTEAPNKVKVLNKRVVNNWIEYRRKQYKQAQALSIERVKKVEDFLKSLEDIEGIRYSDNKYRGELSGKYMKYTYQIGRTGYIDQRTELSHRIYGDNALDIYKELED